MNSAYRNINTEHTYFLSKYLYIIFFISLNFEIKSWILSWERGNLIKSSPHSITSVTQNKLWSLASIKLFFFLPSSAYLLLIRFKFVRYLALLLNFTCFSNFFQRLFFSLCFPEHEFLFFFDRNYDFSISIESCVDKLVSDKSYYCLQLL